MAVLSTGSFYMQQSDNTSRGYAQAASDASYQYYNNMTWSMWLAAGPGNSKHIWSLWEQVSGNNRSWLISTQTTGAIRILLSWNGTNFSNHTTSTLTADYSWKHIVFTFASGTIGCYINGVAHTLTVNTAWTGGAVALHNPAIAHIIGSHSPSAPPADTSPNASVSNFTLWSKVLSAAEVSELYNNGTPTNPTTHSAVANLTNWLRLDQTDSTTTITDQIDSGANMTITESGTSGVFNPGGNYPVNWADLITDAVPTAAQNGAAVWNALLASHTTASTFGTQVKKLLTVAKFLGLK